MAVRGEILLLVLVAVLVPLAIADGTASVQNTITTTETETEIETEIETTAPNPPSEIAVACACEENKHCQCGVSFCADIMGTTVSFNPTMHVEFFDKNLTLKVYLTNEDKVLLSQEFSGEQFVPPLCLPIPQFPAFVFCLGFHDLSCDLSSNSAGLCLILSINMLGNPVPIYPSLPVGCFSATMNEALVYTPPEIQIPGLQESNQPRADKLTVPLNPVQMFPFPKAFSLEEIKKKMDFLPENFGGNAQIKINV